MPTRATIWSIVCAPSARSCTTLVLSGTTGCPDPLPDALTGGGTAGLPTVLLASAGVDAADPIGLPFFKPCILSVLSLRSCSCASFCAFSRSAALLLLADVRGNASREVATAWGVRLSAEKDKV